MFTDSWVPARSRVTSICSGVLDILRRIWVSVAIFVGMRLSSSTRKGRMSCWSARVSVMVKMFSPSRISLAGSWLGILMGMVSP